MAKLDTLDATQPADTEVVSQGASRMREERAAIKDTFDDEHYLSGEHKIPSGTNSLRPPPGSGKPQRIYINQERSVLEQTFSNVWVAVRAVGGLHVLTAAPIAFPTTNYTTVASLTINSPLLAQLIALGCFQFNNPTISGQQSISIGYRIQLDGITLDPGEQAYSMDMGPGNNIPIIPFFLPAFGPGGFGLAEGAHTLTLQVAVFAALLGTTPTVVNRFLASIFV